LEGGRRRGTAARHSGPRRAASGARLGAGRGEALPAARARHRRSGWVPGCRHAWGRAASLVRGARAGRGVADAARLAQRGAARCGAAPFRAGRPFRAGPQRRRAATSRTRCRRAAAPRRRQSCRRRRPRPRQRRGQARRRRCRARRASLAVSRAAGRLVGCEGRGPWGHAPGAAVRGSSHTWARALAGGAYLCSEGAGGAAMYGGCVREGPGHAWPNARATGRWLAYAQ
jgi:hypothetical protein